MALTTGVNVAARPGRVEALGSFVVDADRFGDAGAGHSDRRPGAKDPGHEYIANTAVDGHHRGRRYAPAGLIEYLEAGAPVVPVAPARYRQHQRHHREARTRPGP